MPNLLQRVRVELLLRSLVELLPLLRAHRSAEWHLHFRLRRRLAVLPLPPLLARLEVDAKGGGAELAAT